MTSVFTSWWRHKAKFRNSWRHKVSCWVSELPDLRLEKHELFVFCCTQKILKFHIFLIVFHVFVYFLNLWTYVFGYCEICLHIRSVWGTKTGGRYAQDIRRLVMFVKKMSRGINENRANQWSRGNSKFKSTYLNDFLTDFKIFDSRMPGTIQN